MNAQTPAEAPLPMEVGRPAAAKPELNAAVQPFKYRLAAYTMGERYILFGSAAALVLLFGWVIGFSVQGAHSNVYPATPSMTECTGETLALLDLKQPPTPEVLRQLVEHCYSTLRSQDLLHDFAIRKLNFAQQYRANGILMWMIVIITMSGVCLAALQLLASYRLAEASKRALATSGEISLQHDRIVLRSSVTGLFILLLSFAFFLVYVLYVYRFEKWQDDDLQRPQQGIGLPAGGLGAPSGAPPK
jgi:hypothetical protein